MSLFHCYTQYQPKDPETVRRNSLAKLTWDRIGWNELPVRDEDLPRLWREEGRAFPYIKDVFDFACKGKDPRDIVVYTNCDIQCRSDLKAQMAIILQSADACYSYRRDFPKLTGTLKFESYAQGYAYCGSDLCGFRVGWWQANRHDMPDMILGLEAWDPCYRRLVDITNPGKNVSLKDVIGHERHNSYWERAENRNRLKGQIYCRELAAKWLRRHGVNPKVHGL